MEHLKESNIKHNKIHLVTFAIKNKFIQSQLILDKTYKNANIDTHTMYREENIRNTEFYNKNKNIFNYSVGFGFWIWKPYIILEKLKEINDDDYVYYQDSSRYDYDGFNKSIYPIIDFMKNNNIDILPGLCIDTKNDILIQKECLNYMDADNEYILNHKHYQTSPMFIKKNKNTISFVEKWLYYCQIPQCIIKKTSTHQCDQAILNILLLKNGYKSVYVECTKLESKSYNFFINLFYRDISIELI